MSVSISVTQDLDACRQIREEVFVNEQSVPPELEYDAYDAEAIHLLASENGTPVGTARIVLLENTGKIGRVCVSKSQRGKGLGAALIHKAMEVLAETPGITRALLGSQTHAIGFYQGLGFTAFGPIYDDAGIPHRDMERAVTRKG